MGCTRLLCSPAAIAEVLGCRVSLSRDKYATMCCLESDRIRRLITADWNAAQVHVLPMMQVNFKVGELRRAGTGGPECRGGISKASRAGRSVGLLSRGRTGQPGA